MREFVGRVALITGTTGIGRAIAKRFAAGGAQVVACGIDVAGNQELTREAEELSLTLLVEHCDVTNVDRMRAVITATVSRFGGLDIIVNAAAIHPFGTVVETDLATWNRCMMVNVGSIYLLAHLG
ncbi:MAG: SDR family oxidoreductase, partial [Terriglobales bacterium]